MTDRRIVSIYLPHLPIQRWRRRRFGPEAAAEADPVVLAREGTHGPVIHDLNAAAAALGLQRGARVTDMRALVPHLRVEEADPVADAADLATLAGWARRWCPWTRRDPPEGLFLDTTGSDHLWGGEALMLEEMRAAFAAAGLTARVAVAPTLGAAWALARFAGPRAVCPPAALAETLAPLPAAALRLEGETVTLLRRLGLETIGALAAVPRAALVRRFRQEDLAANPVLRLDQAMGRRAEPLVPGRLEPPLRALRRLIEPIAEVGSVALVLDELMAEVVLGLEEAGQGARRLRLTGYRVDGGAASVEIATSRATRDPAHLSGLFAGRIETMEAGFGFDAMTLDAVTREPLGAGQQDLERMPDDATDLCALIDRLIARWGVAAVLRPVARGSHVPERADALVPAERAAGDPVPAADARPGGLVRPLRLLRRPEEVEVIYTLPDGPPARFVWRRLAHRILRSEGPERIAPEWWREAGSARLRDYYRVEDAEGRRFWIFREGLPGDGRGGPPRWFLQGIDA